MNKPIDKFSEAIRELKNEAMKKAYVPPSAREVVKKLKKKLKS